MNRRGDVLEDPKRARLPYFGFWHVVIVGYEKKRKKSAMNLGIDNA